MPWSFTAGYCTQRKLLMANYRTQIWLSFLFVVALCCIDYAYLSEGMGAILMNDMYRKLGHLIILFAIIAIGYWEWKGHPVQWLKKVWLWSHLLSVLLIVIVGALCYAVGFFDKAFLKKIGDIRLFFCSPVPFFILYILSVISDRLPEMAKK